MDSFFGLDHAAKMEGLTLVASFYDPVSLSIAEEMLKDAGVPYLCKNRGSGGAVRVIAGYQTFGSDIFVREADAARAGEVIAPLLSECAEDQNGENQDDE